MAFTVTNSNPTTKIVLKCGLRVGLAGLFFDLDLYE